MRFNFSHVRTLPEATFELSELGGNVKLKGRIATEANKPYFNAMLKAGGKRLRELARGKLSAEMMARNREEDALLYPKYVITGWSGVEAEDRTPAVFSAEACAEFFAQLVKEAPWVFDRVRNFFAAPENFLEEEEVAPDPAVVMGN